MLILLQLCRTDFIYNFPSVDRYSNLILIYYNSASQTVGRAFLEKRDANFQGEISVQKLMVSINEDIVNLNDS